MKTLLERYLANRAPDGGGDGGGNPGGAGGSGGDGGQAAGGDGSTAGGAGAGGGQGGGDPAAAAAAAAAAGQPYYPEGLRDDMRGTSDRETIDKLYKAFDGYRQRDAQRGQDVPAAAEEYGKFDADKLVGDLKLDAAVAPHLKQLENDPIMKAVGAFGLEHKVPAPVLQGIVATAYAEAQKAGLLDAYVDPEAEKAQLLPESAKSLPKDQQDAAIDARMQANEDFVKLLMKPGEDGKSKLDPKVGEHALLMLMDSAAGNQFLEFFRGQVTGGDRAQAFNGGGSNSGTGKTQREALAGRAALPENTVGNPKFDRASWDALQEDYKKLVGD